MSFASRKRLTGFVAGISRRVVTANPPILHLRVLSGALRIMADGEALTPDQTAAVEIFRHRGGNVKRVIARLHSVQAIEEPEPYELYQ